VDLLKAAVTDVLVAVKQRPDVSKVNGKIDHAPQPGKLMLKAPLVQLLMP
jgi:hypothetical protein